MIKPRIERVYDSHERRYVWRVVFPRQHLHFIICDTHAEAVAAASALTDGMEATA